MNRWEQRMWTAIIAASLVAIIAAFGVSSARYYRRMFSERHLREFHSTLAAAIRAAASMEERPGLCADPRTHFVTEAGLGAAVTFAPHPGGGYDLHFSLSQPGRLTTHAVSRHFGFFILGMLQENKAELTPYFTNSGVRHLSFRLASPAVTVQDFDASYANYSKFLRENKSIPFEYRNIEALS